MTSSESPDKWYQLARLRADVEREPLAHWMPIVPVGRRTHVWTRPNWVHWVQYGGRTPRL